MQESSHHGDRWFKEAVEQAKLRETIAAIKVAVEQAKLRETIAAIKEASRSLRSPLGETKQFPEGVLTPDDEGELRFAITAQAGKVIVAFGKSIEWVGLTPAVARQLALRLNEWAEKAERSP